MAPAPRQPSRSPASSRPAARSSPLAEPRRLSLSRRGALCAARAHSDSLAEPPRRRRRRRASERASGGAAACGRASSAPALVPHPGSGDRAEPRAWGPRPADLRGGVGVGAESGPRSSAAAAAPARTPPFLLRLLLAEPLPHTSRGGAEPSVGCASFLPRAPWQKGALSPSHRADFNPPFSAVSQAKLACTCQDFLSSRQPPVPPRARGPPINLFSLLHS